MLARTTLIIAGSLGLSACGLRSCTRSDGLFPSMRFGPGQLSAFVLRGDRCFVARHALNTREPTKSEVLDVNLPEGHRPVIRGSVPGLVISMQAAKSGEVYALTKEHGLFVLDGDRGAAVRCGGGELVLRKIVLDDEHLYALGSEHRLYRVTRQPCASEAVPEYDDVEDVQRFSNGRAFAIGIDGRRFLLASAVGRPTEPDLQGSFARYVYSSQLQIVHMTGNSEDITRYRVDADAIDAELDASGRVAYVLTTRGIAKVDLSTTVPTPWP